jgi:iron-sulfur cluster assembly protein
LIGFDKQKESDETYYLQDIPIYVDKKHLMYVVGISIDFEETQEGRGFTFERRKD